MAKDLSSLKAYYDWVFQGGSECGCGCTTPQLNPELQQGSNGTMSPLPPYLRGCTVLDLGCGSGDTVSAAAVLVGASGRVMGVDMRHDLLTRAEQQVTELTSRLGRTMGSIQLHAGFPEDLADLGIADNSVDLVVANEYLNLSQDKRSVFSEIFRVLKPGGELCFRTILADRRLPASLLDNAALLRSGYAGAMYTEDFRRLLRDLGCMDYRTLTQQPICINDPEMATELGLASFVFRVIRTFKLTLEDLCEDYGQVALYSGSIPGFPNAFPLDDHHLFISNKPMLVCGNSAAMVEQTRFGAHFTVAGSRSVHYGTFDCS